MNQTNQTGLATAGPAAVPLCRGHLRREGGQWTWAVRQQCGATIHQPTGPAESNTAAGRAILDAIKPNYRAQVQQ